MAESGGGQQLIKQEERWWARFRELEEYKSRFGNCNVPAGWIENRPLANWVMNLRRNYKLLISNDPEKKRKSSLTVEKIRALDSIEFVWEFYSNVDWDVRFSELEQYKAKYGNCNIPWRWGEYSRLAKWVFTQRRQYLLYQEGKKSSMTEEKIAKLESIGFVWALNMHWDERYAELEQYKAKYGDCNVPWKWSKNPQLADWVSRQRRQYRLYQEGKKSSLTEEQFAKLESIGFEWAQLGHWLRRYAELEHYKAKYGNCNVRVDWSENPQLANWVNDQRRRYRLYQEGKQSSMTEEKIAKLERIGFEWDLRMIRWDERHAELEQYKAKYGNCNVPQGWSENPQLANWVTTQRAQYRLYQEGKQSSMTEEKIAKLERIGFVWDLRMIRWDERHAELEQYKAKYGNCNVPKGWSENPQLALWVQNQRSQYRLYQKGKKSSMTEERIAKLESIGFEWTAAKRL